MSTTSVALITKCRGSTCCGNFVTKRILGERKGKDELWYSEIDGHGMSQVW